VSGARPQPRRSSRRETCTADHLPPRAAGMPRPSSADDSIAGANFSPSGRVMDNVKTYLGSITNGSWPSGEPNECACAGTGAIARDEGGHTPFAYLLTDLQGGTYAARRGPAIPYRPRLRAGARRCAASARPAARARQAATPRPRRQATMSTRRDGRSDRLTPCRRYLPSPTASTTLAHLAASAA